VTQSLRLAFGRPQGFQSCAIVGSSGLLLTNPGLGREIDSFAFVIRTNIAPVGGYEQYVGSTTSLRVMNSEALGCVLLERACPRLKQRDFSWCPRYGIFVNSAEHFVSALSRGCGNRTWPVLGWADLELGSDATIRRFRSSKGKNATRRNVMTGAYAIAIAMHLCPNGATAYGFSHGETSASLAAGGGQQVAYHYYDRNVLRNRTDNLNLSARRLAKMAREEPECLRLHQPTPPSKISPRSAEIASRSTVPFIPRVVDPLVDSLRHSYWPSAYYFDVPRGFLAPPVTTCPRLSVLPDLSSRRASRYAHKFLHLAKNLYHNLTEIVVPAPPPSEIAQCGDLFSRTGGWNVKGAPAIVIVYAERVQRPWLLGISASIHGLPLVVVGQRVRRMRGSRMLNGVSDDVSSEEAQARSDRYSHRCQPSRDAGGHAHALEVDRLCRRGATGRPVRPLPGMPLPRDESARAVPLMCA